MAKWTQADVDARCKAWGCEFVRLGDGHWDCRTPNYFLDDTNNWYHRDEDTDDLGMFDTRDEATAALMACEYAPPQHVGTWKAEEIPDDEAEWVLKDGWIWRPTGWHCPDGSFSHRADTPMSLVRAWEQKGQVTRRRRTDRPAPAENKAAPKSHRLDPDWKRVYFMQVEAIIRDHGFGGMNWEAIAKIADAAYAELTK